MLDPEHHSTCLRRVALNESPIIGILWRRSAESDQHWPVRCGGQCIGHRESAFMGSKMRVRG